MYTVGLDVDKLVFTGKILLYAGNSWKSNPLVFIALGIIYLLQNYLLGQSAGNFSFSTTAPASTINTYNKYSDLPKISEHVPLHKRKLNDEELGYFLAGLIEGDGWFGKKELHIIFSESDVSLAYFIKKRVGHGNVYNIKNKKAVRYICKNQKGLSLILSLINGKFVSKYKYEQLIKHNYNQDFNLEILPPLNQLSLDNYWLAGFTQADGCFHISVPKSKTHKTGYSVRLEYSLKQNDCLPLKLLYNYINMGNISQYSSGIWCYKSSGFKTAACLIDYFDKYNLFAGKYVDYLKFRKVYIMVTEGKHLHDKGILKIKRKCNKVLESSCSHLLFVACSIYLWVIFYSIFDLSLYINFSLIIFNFIQLLSLIESVRFIAAYYFRLPSFSLIRRHDLKPNPRAQIWARNRYCASIKPLDLTYIKRLGLRYSSSIAGIKTYDNADTQRLEILKENREKSGVYLWYNKVNGKKYIGSSVNLHKRFLQYYNTNHLLTYSNMNVCDALLKYGYSNFSLFIIEYCEPQNCLVREQYYLDTLLPEYNILQKAGSSLGYKHTDEAKALISAANKGKVRTPEQIANFVASVTGRESPMTGKMHSESTRKKMSEAKQGKNHPMFGKLRTEKVGSPPVKIEVKDIFTNDIKVYESISTAGAALGIKQSTISIYLSRNQKSPYKGRFVFTKID